MRVILDWDGTATTEDTLFLAFQEFGDPTHVVDIQDDYAAGRLSMHEVMRREWATVTASLDEVREWLLPRVELRPGLHAFAETYRPLVVSSGFHELIEPVLEREALHLELVANRATPAASGWAIRFASVDDCPTCGEACKRVFVPPGETAYIGDGYSDRCAALAAGRRFVCGDRLAAFLDERGAAYERFDDFSDIGAALG